MQVVFDGCCCDLASTRIRMPSTVRTALEMKEDSLDRVVIMRNRGVEFA